MDDETETTSTDLSKFKFTKVLGNFTFSKKITLLGKFDEKDAIVLLEKTAFSDTDLPGVLESSQKSIVHFKNDIYSSLCHFPVIDYTGLKTSVICPASEQLIQKYTPQDICIVEESATAHFSITKPHINERQLSLQWVYNILDHQAEVERIAFENPDKLEGFILLPDLKWDGINPLGFYLQALPHIRGLQTIRDLTAEHLPLLRNIAEQAPKAIEEKYNIPKSQLLVYFHYLPSFYHLHVHFRLLNAEGNSGSGCERAHLLSTVIQNLKIASDYYKKVTLSITLKTSDELVAKLQK